MAADGSTATFTPSNGYPMNQPLPTDAIDLERQPEPQAAHIEAEELSEIWAVLELEDRTRARDRAVIAVLSHGLRASEASALNVEHWNGKILTVYRSKGQNVSEVPLGLSRDTGKKVQDELKSLTPITVHPTEQVRKSHLPRAEESA